MLAEDATEFHGFYKYLRVQRTQKDSGHPQTNRLKMPVDIAVPANAVLPLCCLYVASTLLL
jgi:hypothetical protein